MSTPVRALPAYALLIGVNGGELRAPEIDVLRLQKALEAIGIRRESIEVLSGVRATRDNIIRSLKNIATNPRIVENAPIIIYFACHGQQQFITVPGLPTRQAEFLIPFDALDKRSPPIPDITLSALLGRIARQKSNHITLLLDCCHSGSGSRAGEAKEDSSQLSVEQLNLDQATIEQEDGDLWSEFLSASTLAEVQGSARAASANIHSFRYHGVTSHVLLASSHERQKSFEIAYNDGQLVGLFTAAIIEALKYCIEDKMVWNLTYHGLFNRIKDFMINYPGLPQNPQLEGYHRDRYVFASSATPHRHHAISPIELDKSKGERSVSYILPVGLLAGVHQNAMFEIYDYLGGKLKLRGCFPVSKMDNGITIIDTKKDLDLGPDAYAVMCTPPIALRVEMSRDFVTSTWDDPKFQRDIQLRLSEHHPIKDFIYPVQPGSNPGGRLRISGSPRQGTRVQTEHGIINIPINSPPSLIASALTNAVMFHHHLDALKTSSQVSGLFDFRVLELVEQRAQNLPPAGQDIPTALVPHPQKRGIVFTANVETEIVAEHPPETNFGIRLENKTTNNYFIYVFYFDPSDFSITSIYAPPVSDPIPPLLADGTLTIGYGTQGAAPLRFTIDGNMQRDTGIFKVYFSLHASDMSTIQQDGFGSARPGGNVFRPSSPAFGSVLYPITVVNPRARH